MTICTMVKSIICLLQRSHVSWKATNHVKVWDQWQVSFFFFFFFQSGICFRCRLDNPRHFPNCQLPAIGVPMTFDFLQNLVCMCKGKFICSKNCVCVEQNVSCTSICGCQGNEECRNQLSHQLPVADNLGNDEDCPSDI
jgi:hypothetical protein